MKKIMHVSGNIYSKDVFKSSNHTVNIWRELSKDFDEYYIFARAEDQHFYTIKHGKFTLILIPKLLKSMSSFVFSSVLMGFYLRKYKIKLLLLQSSVVGGPAAVLYKKLLGVKLVTEIHGDEYFKRYQKNPILRYLRDLTFCNSERIRSLSSKMTSDLASIGFVDKIYEVYNRVNLQLFAPPKANNDLTGGKVRLVSVGRFQPAKNYEYFIANLNNVSFDYHLTLIGGGPLAERLQQLVCDLNLNDKVTLVASISQPEIVKYLRESDIYFQSSVAEGMPRTIIEAMGMKLPVISTNVGSIEGVLTNEVNSLLCAANSTSIYDCINRLITNDDLRCRIAENGFKEVVEKYEWNKSFNRYRDFINIDKEWTY